MIAVVDNDKIQKKFFSYSEGGKMSCFSVCLNKVDIGFLRFISSLRAQIDEFVRQKNRKHDVLDRLAAIQDYPLPLKLYNFHGPL